MKKSILTTAMALLAGAVSVQAQTESLTHTSDSVYLFSYATEDDQGRSGLKFAWSRDQQKWFDVADGYGYVKCDYGRWGSQKRMIKPELVKGKDGMWHCIWQLNESGQEYGHAASPDLLQWKRQSYFEAAPTDPIVVKLRKAQAIEAFQPATPLEVVVAGVTQAGYIQKRPLAEVEQLVRYADHRAYRQQQIDERTEQDPVRFAGLKPVKATIKVKDEVTTPVSEHLIGIFFEDINYAADGGLYAELVQNRDFEYANEERRHIKEWNSTYVWSLQDGKGVWHIETALPIHPNNPHYAVMNVEEVGISLVNEGFDGITIKKGEKYIFSMFSKVMGDHKGGKIKVRLVTKEGKEIAQGNMNTSSNQWKRQTVTLTATADAADAVLAVCPQAVGEYAFDMISLFPQKTFKGRTNGLRPDLAEALQQMNPRFVRFPGGCVAHGDGIDNIYDWKGSIEKLEERKPLRNMWGYHQTRGLGYHEYFLFCEDLGAEAVPVVAAGVPCQNSGTCSYHSHNELTCGGQQGGIPMEDMPQYIQDVLDLIEYANGDAKKTVWGKKRAEAGHPAPFNLKYVGIGNEDLITDIFEERFKMIFDAVKERYPEIVVIGTVGPFYEGTDYEEGWELATKLQVPMVDEHYYNTPGWFINNQDFYDKYDRNKSKVYLGEYAAHLPGRPNNIETALAEALYLTAIERNADVVTMTSYAPLLAKEGHTQWNPDLIYFNNSEVKPTVGYYTQVMYGQNAGTEYLPSQVTLDNDQAAVKKRVAVSVVKDAHTGDCIVKLVNMLPVAVEADIELPTMKGLSKEAKTTLLSGDPKDKTARPVGGILQVDKQFAYELPAYSFTVIRIKKEVMKKRK
ncbi:MAG: alpha-L-arabinofuranosidase C-terminal domain-containing protein [Phocaeicola sp.]